MVEQAEEVKLEAKVPDKIAKGKIVLSTNTILGKGATAKVFKQKDGGKCVKVFEKSFIPIYRVELKVLQILSKVEDKIQVTPKIYMTDNQQYAIEMAAGIGDLKTLTNNKIKHKQNWSEYQLLGIVRQIGAYVNFMSNECGIYHCQINLQNVVVMADEITNFEVKLIDFATAITDVGQHPKLTKSNSDNFCDKQKEFAYMKLQCEILEIASVLTLIKQLLNASIFSSHANDMIRMMKYYTTDYWKVVDQHSRVLSSFLQKWSEDTMKNINETQLLELYEDMRKLK